MELGLPVLFAVDGVDVKELSLSLSIFQWRRYGVGKFVLASSAVPKVASRHMNFVKLALNGKVGSFQQRAEHHVTSKSNTPRHQSLAAPPSLYSLSMI